MKLVWYFFFYNCFSAIALFFHYNKSKSMFNNQNKKYVYIKPNNKIISYHFFVWSFQVTSKCQQCQHCSCRCARSSEIMSSNKWMESLIVNSSALKSRMGYKKKMRIQWRKDRGLTWKDRDKTWFWFF